MNGSVYLAHHGVKGQKWGVRRYQNKNGTYTNLGKSRKKELLKGFGVSAAAGLAGGILAGAAGFALSTTNPAFLSTAAVTYIGKTAVSASLNSSAQFAVKAISESKTTDIGRRSIRGDAR